MKSLHRLLEILETLSSKEFKRLKFFLGHLREHRKDRTIKILETLWKYLKKGNYQKSNALDKALIKTLNNVNKSTQKQLSNYLLDILIEVERFLVYDLMSYDSFIRFRFMSEVTKNKNLHEQYLRTLIEQRKLLNGMFNEMWQLNYLFELSYKQYSHPFQNHYVETENKISVNDNINILNDFYILAQLKLQCEAISVNSVLDQTKPDLLLEAVIKEKIKTNPVLKLYYQLYLLLSGQEVMNTNEVLIFFEENKKILNSNEQIDFLAILTNHTSIHINKTSNNEYSKLSLQLYKQSFPIDITDTEKPFIEATLYINITKVGLLLNDIHWVEQFIESYKNCLQQKDREVTYQFCKANIYFERKDYKNAAPILAAIESKDFSLMLRVKLLYVKVQFESEFIKFGDKEIVKKITKTLKDELKKHPYISNDIKMMYKNFIKFIHQMLTVKPNFDKIIEEIEMTTPIASKSWLINKSRILKKRGVLR